MPSFLSMSSRAICTGLTLSIVTSFGFSQVSHAAESSAPRPHSPANWSDAELDKKIEAITQSIDDIETARNNDVRVPTSAADPVTVRGSDGSHIQIGLPGKGSADNEDNELTSIFAGEQRATQVAIQPTTEGVRAIISIESKSAPERFEFPIDGDVSRLAIDSLDGSVMAFDRHDEPLGYFDTPWAFDNNGTPVPTHFEIKGTTLFQIVEHHGGDYSYGIRSRPRLEQVVVQEDQEAVDGLPWPEHRL